MRFVFERIEKNCGKRRKCWLIVFSSLLTMFSKALFFRVFKSLDCLVKSQLKEITEDNFKFDEKRGKVSKRVENTVGKVEIAHHEQFLLFP